MFWVGAVVNRVSSLSQHRVSFFFAFHVPLPKILSELCCTGSIRVPRTSLRVALEGVTVVVASPRHVVGMHFVR